MAIIILSLIFILAMVLLLIRFWMKPLNGDDLHSWLTQRVNKGQFEGVVLLAQGDKILYQGAFGYEDMAQTQPLTPQSCFNLASVSKPFTAMAVLILIEDQVLSLDDALSDHFAEFSHYPGVRIRHLLQHNSGLPEYFPLAMKYGDRQRPFTGNDLLALFKQHKPKARFGPGERFEYCNTGYVLLAELVARVSGMAFADFMHQRVFLPAHMHSAQVFNLTSQRPPNRRVWGYKRAFLGFGPKRLKDLNWLDGVFGDGAVYANAHDLLAWHQALLEHRLISPALQKQAFSGSPYGFGWFVKDKGWVHHAGGWQGFASYLEHHPNTGHLMVILDRAGHIVSVSHHGFKVTSLVQNLRPYLLNQSKT